MKTTVSQYDFVNAFRAVRPDNFSREGLLALFGWLEAYERDTGTEIELDVIALCCDFSEYSTLAEFQADYGADYETIEDIQNETTVIAFDNGFIIQNF